MVTPGRRRLIGAGVLAGSFSALFIVPSAVLDSADLSPMTVFVGLVAPGGVAALAWVLKREDFREIDTRTSHQATPDRLPSGLVKNR